MKISKCDISITTGILGLIGRSRSSIDEMRNCDISITTCILWMIGRSRSSIDEMRNCDISITTCILGLIGRSRSSIDEMRNCDNSITTCILVLIRRSRSSRTFLCPSLYTNFVYVTLVTGTENAINQLSNFMLPPGVTILIHLLCLCYRDRGRNKPAE